MVTSNGFCLPPNATFFLVNKTPYSRLSSPWPATSVSHSRYDWKVGCFLSWRDTQRIPYLLLHGTVRDERRSWHRGSCALAPGTRAPWDHRAFLEVGGPLPADPDSVGMVHSRGRDCHQSKNHPFLSPSVSYPLVVAFGLHQGSQQYARTEPTNQSAMQHLPLLKACTVNGNNW